MTAKIAYLQN